MQFVPIVLDLKIPFSPPVVFQIETISIPQTCKFLEHDPSPFPSINVVAGMEKCQTEADINNNKDTAG